ncbi:MAG: thiamine-phosphate kinase [Acidobacteriaceae bacterium]
MAESPQSRVRSEGALIAAIRRQAMTAHRSPELRLGIGDDCAVLRPAAGEEIVVTTDFSLEGVHFRREWHSPESVGHRCLARGLSDIAAMGARPVAAFLSMALPKELVQSRRGKSWLDRFLNGLLALADQYHVPLAGGDTAQSLGPACFDIILVGAVKRGHALLRSGAKAGDAIYVTGALGGAAAELLALESNPQRFTRLVKATNDHPHMFPQPRIAVAARIRSAANAAIDISDGLSTDLAHLCEESSLSAELDTAKIPIHPIALKAERDGLIPSAVNLALHGGDDYELLFTASPAARIPQKIAGVRIHKIGRMAVRRKGRPQMTLRKDNDRISKLEPRGWEHFR